MSEVPKTDQVPLTPVEASMDSYQDAGKGKETKALQGKDKGKDKKKDFSKPAEKALDTTISQSEQAADLGAPKAQA